MFNWPTAVVVVAIALFIYGLVDTWLKQPMLHKRVGNLEITLRGEEAREAIRQFVEQTRRDAEAADQAPASHFRRGDADAA